MAVELGFQIGKDAGPLGKVVEGGIGGIAAIGIGLTPGPASLVFRRQHGAGVSQIATKSVKSAIGGEGGLIDLGNKEGPCDHARALMLSGTVVKASLVWPRPDT